MESSRLEIRRVPELAERYPQIKDPSVVKTPDGQFKMFASIGSTYTEKWQIGRFIAADPKGPWQELEPVNITKVEGGEVCAPAVLFDKSNPEKPWKMYVQTTCFSPGGVIAKAVSSDGQNFEGLPEPVMAKEKIAEPAHPLVGIYDVAISDVKYHGESYECMLFSGYRQIGNGDVYMAMRKCGDTEWSAPKLVLQQEDVPFHNRPGSANYEWGLEGAKIVQLEDRYLMIGVCFLDKEKSHYGTRQRVFLAASCDLMGPYVSMMMPLEPTKYAEGTGENGHPDTLDLGDKIAIIYQERAHAHAPWHLRYTDIEKDKLLFLMNDYLQPEKAPPVREHVLDAQAA